MSQHITENLMYLADLLRKCGRSVYILDGELRCLWSGSRDLLAEGEPLGEYIFREEDTDIFESGQYSCYKNGSFYCVRLARLAVGGETAYICEIIDRVEASEILHRTDCYSDALPLCGRIDACVGELWAGVKKLPSECGALAQDMMAALYRLTAAEKSLLEYTEMAYAPKMNVVFDITKLCVQLTTRCNNSLKNTGRSVSFASENTDKLYICADSRRAVNALVSTIQIMLLCSSAEDPIAITVQRTEKRGEFYVVVSVESVGAARSVFSDDDTSGIRRARSALPVVDKFAQMSGGSFEIVTEEGRAAAVLTLPEATADDLAVCRLEEVSIDTDDGVPDIADVKMQEVAAFMREW